MTPPWRHGEARSENETRGGERRGRNGRNGGERWHIASNIFLSCRLSQHLGGQLALPPLLDAITQIITPANHTLRTLKGVVGWLIKKETGLPEGRSYKTRVHPARKESSDEIKQHKRSKHDCNMLSHQFTPSTEGENEATGVRRHILFSRSERVTETVNKL